MRYAEVSVNSPIARRRSFSYAIPPGLDVRAGQAVWVPFGDKVLQGIVLELSPLPAVEDTREIISVIEPEPLLSPASIALARWISDYYLSPLFAAIALMLPPGFERNAITFIELSRRGYDTYGSRVVCVVYVETEDGVYLNLNKALLDEGLAVVDDYPNEFNPALWTSEIYRTSLEMRLIIIGFSFITSVILMFILNKMKNQTIDYLNKIRSKQIGSTADTNH